MQHGPRPRVYFSWMPAALLLALCAAALIVQWLG